MLRQRIIVALILLPIGIFAILVGDVWYAAVIALILGLAAYEYVQLFRSGGWQPAGFLVIAGTVALVAARHLGGLSHDGWLLPALVFLSMAAHLIAYERGRDQAATDFGVTIGGIFYIGLLGSFLIPLRALPNGEWWVLVVLPAAWLADTGAYFIGSKYGRHKMTPRLSPNKSWEGYFGGIVFSVIGTPLLVQMYYQFGLDPSSLITVGSALIIGILMSVIPTLGDLGESMIKRQMGKKDSGTVLPGHGGMFDRIDSWLWAAVFGYFAIVWFF